MYLAIVYNLGKPLIANKTELGRLHSPSYSIKSIGMSPYIGTAAWNIPTAHQKFFDSAGSHLQKYSQIFNAVEINSSFYKEHKMQTYEKWRDSVPADFRFSVKLAKVITHENKLKLATGVLKSLLAPILALEEKLGCILVQTPPSLTFNDKLSRSFFSQLRDYYQGQIAFEPRHQTWESRAALEIETQFRVIRVDADPISLDADPELESFKLRDFLYLRLHGSPHIYRSEYGEEPISLFADLIRDREAWVIFDNTALGYATLDAIKMNKHFSASK